MGETLHQDSVTRVTIGSVVWMAAFAFNATDHPHAMEAGPTLAPWRTNGPRWRLSFCELWLGQVEAICAGVLYGTVIEANEQRFDAAAIRRLYEAGAYPLARRPVA